MKSAAFFDVDGTLINAFTQNVLAKLMMKRGFFSFAQSTQIFTWFLLYKLGLFTNSVEIRRNVYRVFGKQSKEKIDQLFSDANQRILAEHLRDSMRTVVEQHRRQGDMIIAVSGSLTALCKPICEQYAIDKLYATELISENGKYTGAWKGVLLEGKNKADLIKKVAGEGHIDLIHSTAYADSYSDVPMLEIVGDPAVVSPDPKLRNLAQRKGWRILAG